MKTMAMTVDVNLSPFVCYVKQVILSTVLSIIIMVEPLLMHTPTTGTPLNNDSQDVPCMFSLNCCSFYGQKYSPSATLV